MPRPIFNIWSWLFLYANPIKSRSVSHAPSPCATITPCGRLVKILHSRKYHTLCRLKGGKPSIGEALSPG